MRARPGVKRALDNDVVGTLIGGSAEPVTGAEHTFIYLLCYVPLLLHAGDKFVYLNITVEFMGRH